MNKQQLANRIWASANKMRSKIDANEYKDYILGLIFYKFLSDTEVKYLEAQGVGKEDLPEIVEDYSNKDLATLIEECRENIGFFIEYKYLFNTWLDKQDFSVSTLSEALSSFDRLMSDNYKSVYSGIFKTLREGLVKLGENPTSQTKALKGIIKLIKDIPTDGSQDYDVLGYVYEFLIGNFAANAGKKAGEFYTPHEVAMIMSEIVAEHHKDKDHLEIYDPTSGSGSLLITIGKAVGKHIQGSNRIKYYAQELKENTYNLTRMNLVMRGIIPANIVTRCADSLDEDWPLHEEGMDIAKPLAVDAVVSNPPYSQHWDPKDKELDPRFVNYGLAPKTKADYAFLLHELHHLKHNGILTIVMPHGVLFRGKAPKIYDEEGNLLPIELREEGQAEGQIRANLIEKNNIDAIIGLPANIFYGTGIPTLIMVLKKNRGEEGVLIIDASKGFVKDGKQNKLQARDVKKIVDVYRNRATIPGFSREVSRDEIRKNGYNLNIPRYVDSSEPPIKYDIYSTMFGGIPNSEIAELQTYWTSFPSLQSELFESQTDCPYSSVKVEDVIGTIQANKDVAKFKEQYNEAFQSLKEMLRIRLIDHVEEVKEVVESEQIANDIFSRAEGLPLIDKYDAYQILADQWPSIIGDIEIIQTEGYGACNVVETKYKIVKKDGVDEEVEDGLKGRIMPFELIQETLLPEELATLRQLQKSYEEQEGKLAELLEGLDTEEQDALLNDDNTKFDKTKVNNALNEILAEVSTPEIEMLNVYLALSKKYKLQFVKDHPSKSWSLMEQSKDGTYAKKAIQAEQKRLAMLTDFEEDSYEDKVISIVKARDLSDSLAKEIVDALDTLIKQTIVTIQHLDMKTIIMLLEKKWIEPITSAIAALPDDVLRKLCDRIRALEEKYAVSYNDLNRQLVEAQDELSNLISELTGDEFAIRGLNEFKNSLKD